MKIFNEVLKLLSQLPDILPPLLGVISAILAFLLGLEYRKERKLRKLNTLRYYNNLLILLDNLNIEFTVNNGNLLREHKNNLSKDEFSGITDLYKDLKNLFLSDYEIPLSKEISDLIRKLNMNMYSWLNKNSKFDDTTLKDIDKLLKIVDKKIQKIYGGNIFELFIDQYSKLKEKNRKQ